jgi:FtsP/CotA-like multicopper oxidase with cupredoxin domain
VLKTVPVAATLLLSPEGPFTRRRADADATAFPQPLEYTPGPGGTLDATLDVRFADVDIPGFHTIHTRNYNASIPGPTLRLRGGDRLRLTQINGLPKNTPPPDGIDTPHDFNTFNLHTHGLHVSPSGNADNVFREFTPRATGQSPEPRYLSEIEIPCDHPAGTFWYHPHHHGSTAMQVAGGMAGVIIIEGDIDKVPEIAAAKDVVVCINELRTLANGTVPDFVADDSLTNPQLVTATFPVNGQVNPVITMRPGELQRWRLVAATALTRLELHLDTDQNIPVGAEMHQIAMDGITFPTPLPKTEVILGMGNRADVLVRFAVPGEYQLRRDAESEPLMTIVVQGEPMEPPMPLPRRLPPGKPYIGASDVTDPAFQREINFTVNGNVFSPPFPNAYRVLGTNPTPPLVPVDPPDPGDPKYGRFDPDFVNQALRLGDVERWVLGPTEFHPFHLHTNHFLVTHVNGQPLNPPIWQDTISAGGTVTFLVKYQDFTGKAVLHCHNLKHEDLGMMQVINYVDHRKTGS